MLFSSIHFWRKHSIPAMLDSFYGAPVKLIVLDTVPEDREVIAAWNNLVFHMERPEVFFTHQWALAASRALSGSVRPRIFLMHESGQLAGVAAMATSRESTDSAVFLTASTADYCDIVSAPEAREGVVNALLAEMKRLGMRNLVLANIPKESTTLRALSIAARSHGFHRHQRLGYDCGVIALGEIDQRREVLKSIWRRKTRLGLRKLCEMGTIQVAHLTSEQAEAEVRSICMAQISRFLAANQRSPLLQPQRRLFLAELARLMAPAGWLKISCLQVGDRSIAWNYGFRFFESWFWYLPTFEVQYEKFSPGLILLRLLTEEACGDPSVKRLDLGLGDEIYKARFANAVSSTCYVRLSRTILGHLSTVGRYWLSSSMGRFPTVDQRLRRGRDRIRRLRSRMAQTGALFAVVHLAERAARIVKANDEIAFFEAPPIEISHNQITTLSPLGWNHLANAAMHYSDDEQTLAYLARCAQHLKQGQARGYFLQERGQGTPPALHFLWVRSYQGFQLSEIDFRLESANPSAVLIFDCWTPAAERGHNYFADAIRLAASDLQKQQKQIWIFTAIRNKPSVNGIIKAAFVYRFSLERRRRFGSTTLSRRDTVPPGCLSNIPNVG